MKGWVALKCTDVGRHAKMREPERVLAATGLVVYPRTLARAQSARGKALKCEIEGKEGHLLCSYRT